MTIRREGKRPPVISCDGCGVVADKTKLEGYAVFNYAARWDEAKAAGWTAARKPEGKDWNHICPDCSSRAPMAVKPKQDNREPR
jgi:hypothetical protein